MFDNFNNCCVMADVIKFTDKKNIKQLTNLPFTAFLVFTLFIIFNGYLLFVFDY